MPTLSKVPHAPSGVFKGRNFVTPNVQGFYRGRIDGKTAYAELSNGEGIFDREKTLWGVTFRRANSSDTYEQLSGCFESREAAMERIREAFGVGQEVAQ